MDTNKPAFLKRVVIDNFRSIASCDVRLGPLTILVGPNGAGKSNFLDALRFVSDALTDSVESALKRRGSALDVCHYGGTAGKSFGIRLEFALPSGTTGHYAFRIGSLPEISSSSWEVLEEECVLRLPNLDSPVAEYHNRHPGVEVNGGIVSSWSHDRLTLPFAAAMRERSEPGSSSAVLEAFQDAYLALKRMSIYAIRPEAITDIESVNPGHFLSPDGDNLASTLFIIASQSPTAFERINDYLRVVLPALAKVRVEPVLGERQPGHEDPQRIALLFEQLPPGKGAHLFLPSQTSAGTLRTLGVLVALLQAMVPTRPPPSIVGIEDVEAAIHPAALGVIVDAMQEAALSTQVIATSHSPDLLDSRTLSPDAILAVECEAGETVIGPLGEAGASVLRDKLYSPGELLRIGQISPSVRTSESTKAALFGPSEGA